MSEKINKLYKPDAAGIIANNLIDFYKESISQILKSLGTDSKKIEFIQGSKFQLGNEYIYDVLKMAYEM